MLHIHMFHCRTNSLITEFCPGTPYTIYIYACVHAKFLQSCPALCNCMECSPPGTFIHGILQARILEWIVMPSAGDLPDPWIEPMSLMSPALAGRCFATTATPGKHTCMPHLLYSPDLSPIDYHFFKHLQNFLLGKCFHNQQEQQMHSKSSSILKHGVLSSRNKQTFLTGKNALIVKFPILINKDVLEPSYKGLKFMV